MAKPTVHDIAELAGVSLATVDRVLNERPGVREKTAARVRAAIDRLGYVRDAYAANLARKKVYRFVFALPSGPSQFADAMRAALAEASKAQAAERITTRAISIPAQDPHAVARALNALNPEQVDGVAILAPETPQLRDAVARLKAEGLAVVAFVSDLPNSQRDRFVGIDNIEAGRTAGVLMGRFIGARPGRVFALTNSLQARDSVERRLGFDEVLAARFPQLEAAPTLEFYDDAQRLAALVREVLAKTRDLVGLYSMGRGNTPLLETLRDAGRPEGLVVIAHELTPSTRSGLIGGEFDAVIAQNVGHLVRSALRVLRARTDGAPIFEAQERIRIDIVIRENLP